MTKKLFVIETVSMHRMAYCIKANSQAEAESFLTRAELPNEFGQTHIGENIFYTQEVSEGEYIELFDDLNDYLKDITEERKLSYIIKEEDNESKDRKVPSKV